MEKSLSIQIDEKVRFTRNQLGTEIKNVLDII